MPPGSDSHRCDPRLRRLDARLRGLTGRLLIRDVDAHAAAIDALADEGDGVALVDADGSR